MFSGSISATPGKSGLIRRLAVLVCLATGLAVADARGQGAHAAHRAGPGRFCSTRPCPRLPPTTYQESVDAINTLLQNLPKDLPPADKAKLDSGLEPIYFTRGAAYFNLKDYAKATAALKEYVAKYPKGNRLADAKFSLAQASYLTKDYDEATRVLAPLENNREYREQALLLEGLAYKEGGKLDPAIGALERLTANGIKTPAAAKGALQLIRDYAEKKEPDKAFKILAEVQANIGQVENVVDLNATALAQGDAYLQDAKWNEALTCYRAVRTKNEVINLEKERVAALQERLKDIVNAMRADPKNAAQYLMVNRQVQDSIAEDQKLVEDFSKLPSFRSKLLYRMGRAFAGNNDTWKAVVAYTDAYEVTQDAADREPALYALITAYADVNQPKDARADCDQYLKEFPKGANASTVGYLYGVTALQENDAPAAEGYFGRVLAEQPDSTLRNGDHLPARQRAVRPRQVRRGGGDLPQVPGPVQGRRAHRRKRSTVWRCAACSAATTTRRPSGSKLTSTNTRKGDLVPDAKYRLAVCDNAAQDYKKVIDECQAWTQGSTPATSSTGEVLALLGDAYVATDKVGRGVRRLPAVVQDGGHRRGAQLLAVRGGQDPPETRRVGQGGRHVRGVRQDHPDHPAVVQAAYWIGRAKAKLGKTDEAKQYLAGMVKKYIDDPDREAVEQLLDQLATMCLKQEAAGGSGGLRGRRVPGGFARRVARRCTVVAEATPAPAPEATPDPGASNWTNCSAARSSDRSPTAKVAHPLRQGGTGPPAPPTRRGRAQPPAHRGQLQARDAQPS